MNASCNVPASAMIPPVRSNRFYWCSRLLPTAYQALLPCLGHVACGIAYSGSRFAMTYKAVVVGIALVVAAVSAAAAQGGNQAFVTKMGEVSMGEVDLGRLADEKASSRDVKGFAKRMIEEHGKSGEELKGIAARKNLTWPAGPGADATALKDKLS